MRFTPTRHVLVGSLVAAACSMIPFVADAQEDEPVLTVTDGDHELVRAGDGTASLTVTVAVNGVDAPTQVSILVSGTEPGQCTPASVPVLQPGVAKEVTFELSATCDVPDTVTVELVTLPFDAAGATRSGVRIDASLTDEPSDSEYHLAGWGFGIGLLVALVSALAAWRIAFCDQRGAPAATGSTPTGANPNAVVESRPWPPGPLQKLPGLGSKWTWSDSPVSSATVAAALFTAVLGASDVLEEILGDSSDNEVAVVVVAAALATALTAAAPVMLALFRDEPANYKVSDDVPNNYTVLGVLAATITVVAGNLGLILAIVLTMWDNSAVNRWVVLVGALLTGVLVVAYTVRSMRRTLKIGMVGVTPSPPPEGLVRGPAGPAAPGVAAMP